MVYTRLGTCRDPGSLHIRTDSSIPGDMTTCSRCKTPPLVFIDNRKDRYFFLTLCHKFVSVIVARRLDMDTRNVLASCSNGEKNAMYSIEKRFSLNLIQFHINELEPFVTGGRGRGFLGCPFISESSKHLRNSQLF